MQKNCMKSTVDNGISVAIPTNHSCNVNGSLVSFRMDKKDNGVSNSDLYISKLGS